MSPVRRLKKLVSYYSINWRNSTSLSDSDTSSSKDADSDRNPRDSTSIVKGRDSTRFHKIPPQSSKDDPDDKDDPNNKDDPNEKDHLNSSLTYQLNNSTNKLVNHDYP